MDQFQIYQSFSMKIMSWNSRGSSWQGFHSQPHYYAAHFDLNVFCLIDTRASLDYANEICDKLPPLLWNLSASVVV